MTLSRRSLFAGLAATIAAPAIIRTPGLLMPIKAIRPQFAGGIAFSLAAGAVNRVVLQESDDGVNWIEAYPQQSPAGGLLFFTRGKHARLVSSIAGDADTSIHLGYQYPVRCPA